MKRVLFALLLLLPLSAGARELPKPQLIAVYFYADWCANCKILSPKIDEVKTALTKENVLFVTMNLTDKATIHQSILLAQGLGIGEYLQAQGSATGYMALLDSGSKKELIRFDRESTGEVIRKEIEARLK